MRASARQPVRRELAFGSHYMSYPRQDFDNYFVSRLTILKAGGGAVYASVSEYKAAASPGPFLALVALLAPSAPNFADFVLPGRYAKND